jgi:hypothetical protein
MISPGLESEFGDPPPSQNGKTESGQSEWRRMREDLTARLESEQKEREARNQADEFKS